MTARISLMVLEITMRKYAYLFVLVIAFILNATEVAGFAADYTLSNERIEVKFNGRGLVAVKDIALDRMIRFFHDSFSVTIDGERIDSASLVLGGIGKSKGRIVYSFESGPYSIRIVYELKSGWRFISKQLFISKNGGGDFHVNEVEVFRFRIDNRIDSDYAIRTAKEGFIKHHELRDYGAFVRFDSSWGAFVLVQNPFQTWLREGSNFFLTYPARMDWKSEYGSFVSDRGCIGIYQLTGHRIPGRMVEEWLMSDDAQPENVGDGVGMDQAEIDAYIDCVRAFLLHEPNKSVRIHIPWCENDYQIDVAEERDREQWKRIVDMASQIGITHVLYTVTNSNIATRAEAADAWRWENLLWLNMGPKIRRNEWDPKYDELPELTRQLQDYAADRGVKLMAYVYPSLPFSQNKDWLSRRHPNDERLSASLGVRSYQDWLIRNLLEFYHRNDLGGFAFDYMFMWQPGTSRYAQWWGCRRVLEELRRQAPDIVIDGRQLYHCYGPWTWLAGTYPHPTAADEQPESFEAFPDLHFDRVSANRQRYTAYWYRNTQFCPVEIMPGFITHQTARKDGDGEMRLDHFNTRDWDYLGWKYSLFSSIATAPFNHCVDMIPARDLEEYKLFAEEDKQFLRTWFDWTDKNADILKKTRTIIGQPALGYIDGTAALDKDRGYIFLFNPNHRKLNAEFKLDNSIGLIKGSHFVLKHLYSEKGKIIGEPERGIWNYGDVASIPMDGTSTLVLELTPAPDKITEPILFNAQGKVKLQGSKLILTEVKGEVGTRERLLVMLPSGHELSSLSVNDRPFTFKKTGNIVEINVGFKGTYFSHAQQIGKYDPGFSGTDVAATFEIPGRIFAQLRARKEKWPIAWIKEDHLCTWLVPERLLLYVQIAEPDWQMDVEMKIDSRDVEVKKAYSSITPGMLKQGKGHNTFVGFYTDISGIEPDKEHKIELTLPKLKPGQFQGIFFENVETEYTTIVYPY